MNINDLVAKTHNFSLNNYTRRIHTLKEVLHLNYNLNKYFIIGKIIIGWVKIGGEKTGSKYMASHKVYVYVWGPIWGW